MSISKGIALITGSAQGIGRSIALRLARDGFNVALNDLPNKDAKLEVVANQIESLGRQAYIVPSRFKEMVDDTVTKLGGLDVVSFSCPPLATVESWDHTLSVNARGAYLCYKYAAIQMIEQGRGGRIIGASSIVGKMDRLPHNSSYTASKFAVRGLTQAAAVELGQYGITVNAYAPGAIHASMTKVVLDESGNWFQSVFENVPIKHIGQPEDIASIVSYLASKEAHFITGQFMPLLCLSPAHITVDGGLNMG
ncbi:uncharacterized protein F5147DRAFT_670873 [Suillus discolor]|uniref:Uncharacterized protein n=1 Tax=Suillus discolor TaxID=1912936 RepID=A0A9P7JYH1_9AGAM|nr:uncharacterized protein F5147DRAFT_670873 [Suillus discolor]KAG2117049.1 hypothetical protein F5147DRAFT_670873 [Suillus discolor]